MPGEILTLETTRFVERAVDFRVAWRYNRLAFCLEGG
jgi:hypothetical protein